MFEIEKRNSVLIWHICPKNTIQYWKQPNYSNVSLHIQFLKISEMAPPRLWEFT